MAPPNSGDLRKRKGKEATGDDDDAVLEEAAASQPKTRQIFMLLGGIQLLILGGFAYTSYTKKTAPVVAALVLTDETAFSFVDGHPEGALLNFHMPGCAHCEALAPEFEKAAKELAAKGGAPLASVGSLAAPLAIEKYGITRFPSMYWFRKGQPVLELPPGSRSVEKIVEYVEWAGQPAIIDFESRAEFEEAVPTLRATLDATTPVVVGFAGKGVSFEVLEGAAERSRGKTAFLFIKESNADDPAIRAVFSDAALDKDYTGQGEGVDAWVKELLASKMKSWEKK